MHRLWNPISTRYTSSVYNKHSKGGGRTHDYVKSTMPITLNINLKLFMKILATRLMEYTLYLTLSIRIRSTSYPCEKLDTTLLKL